MNSTSFKTNHPFPRRCSHEGMLEAARVKRKGKIILLLLLGTQCEQKLRIHKTKLTHTSTPDARMSISRRSGKKTAQKAIYLVLRRLSLKETLENQLF